MLSKSLLENPGYVSQETQVVEHPEVYLSGLTCTENLNWLDQFLI